MANTIGNLFATIDIFSSLPPVLIFLIFFKQSKDEIGIRIIVTYSIVSFIINYWMLVTSVTNTFLYESYTLLEFLLFIAFLFSQINRPNTKKLILFFSGAFILFFFTYTLLAKAVKSIDSVPIGVETIIILGFSFYYLYERMNDTRTLFIYNTYQFWIVLGIVMYLAGCFFIYIFASYLRNSFITDYWFVTNIFSIIKNIVFCIAIYLHVKPPKDGLSYNLELSQLN